MNIDDLADDRADREGPGERFREQWLASLPEGQWPAYIDESAQLIADGIFIGDTQLTSGDFGMETGRYYRRGLANSADIDLSGTSLPLGRHSAREVGRVAWMFNQLRQEIRSSTTTNFRNPSRAIEAAVNKALVESIETGRIEADDLETIRLPEDASVSTLVSEVFCRPRSETYVKLLLETTSNRVASSLLELLDEPRMVTELWDHQREALTAWLENDARGYVDMATATGKTVLGLAAIAHHFGALHPADRSLVRETQQPGTDSRATVVVVAHRDLILDQWKREFDTHLNIPEQSTTSSGEHTAEFEWGDVYFWTPNRLQERGVPDADLVVLDETHHYLGSSGFGGIVDEIEGDVLALSGSLDEANARTLERRGIPKLYEFSLRDGQKAGVVPQCDWDVILTPYQNQSQLAEITTRCQKGIERYADGVDVPSDADIEEDVLHFETLSEARSLVQSTAGRTLKERDPDFREFASAVMARQLTKYNLSPTLSTVAHLVLDNVDQHKCVVLLETEEEIERVTEELRTQLGDAYESSILTLGDDEDLSTIESFDFDWETGAIVGTARTLGEGVDIETADVCINRGRGRLSRSLVQRMGRILRNPNGDKHAQFYHITGIPTRDDATLPKEDSIELLETASQLLSWGEGFNARPVFAVDDETTLTERDLAEFEAVGASAIDQRTPVHYDWPPDADVRSQLQSLLEAVCDSKRSALLGIERPEREERTAGSEMPGAGEQGPNAAVQFIAADGGAAEVADWLYTLASAAAETDVESFVEESVRSYARESLAMPQTGEIPRVDSVQPVPLNPALEGVLATYAAGDGGTVAGAVHAALATAVQDDLERLADRSGISTSKTELQAHIEEVLDGE